jgi:hypothetical protein
MSQQMNDLDLNVAPEHIADFIGEAQRGLRSRRVKTVFGREESTHWIYTVLGNDQAMFPTMVVLKVRSLATKKGGRDVRVFLNAVRPLEPGELVEAGYSEPSPWPDELAARAWDIVVRELQPATIAVTKALPATEFRRGYLAFTGHRMSGEYRASDWRLATPHFPEDPAMPASIFTEQMVACDRLVSGRDSYDIAMRFVGELERLALLLTVIWCTHVEMTNRVEQRWVYGDIVDGELPSRLRQIGFSEPSAHRPSTMPPLGTLPPGPTWRLDRLNPYDHAGKAGEFIPPEDATDLLELFYAVGRADPMIAERFLAAAKAYHTASFIYRATATGSLAYLVVAAESLVEEELPTCPECNSKRGLSRAMRGLIFEELPCLTERKNEVEKLLKEAYDIRSKHFHTGRFAGGELEPWHSISILEPERQSLMQLWQRMNAMVNALLIAWLVKRATGTPWPRASEPMPKWDDAQMFATTIHL